MTGSPTIALNSGGTATYNSGSGTATLTFNYTVGAGDNAADLDYSATNSLALSGGTIKDAATNNATLTLPAVGGASSIGGQKNIVVDTNNPTASVTTPAIDGNSYNAASLPSNLAGSSADTGGSSTVSTVQVAIQDGAGNYWGGATFNQASIFYNAAGGTVGAWTYGTGTLVGQLTNGHTYTITARSTDPAGNTGTTTRTFVYDTTAPTVTNVTSTKADGAYPVGTLIPVTVTFSENVTVTGSPTIALNSGGTATYNSGSGTATLTFNYTVGAGDNAADLDYSATNSLALSGGTIKDAATNNATLTLPAVGGANSIGGQKNIVVDTNNPTASVTTPAIDGSTYNAASLPANLAGSSADTGGSSTVSSVQVAIQDGAGNYWGGATFNQASIFYNATGGTVGAWTYGTGTLVGQLTNGHTYTITARSTDPAGNTGTTTRTFVYDTTAPTVTNVTSTKADGAYPVGTLIPVTVTFSENVTVTGTPTIALNSGGTASYNSGSGSATLTFNYTVGAGDNAADLDYSATNSLALCGGTIKDAATNNATLTLPAVGGANSIGGQKDIVVDTSAPTVSSVSSSTANGAYKAGQTIAVTITFTEPVTVTGTPKLTLNTTPAETADYASGSGGSTLTFNYTVQAGDTAADLDYAATSSLALNGGTIKDVATNSATLTLPAVGGASSLGGQKDIVVDTTNPTASITAPGFDGLSYNASILPANIAGGSADIGGSGVATVQVAIQDGAGNYWGGATFNQASIFYNATGGTVGVWTYATGTLVGQLTNTHTYTITARSTDAAGNTGTTTRTFVYDTSAPTVNNVNATNPVGAYKAGDTIHVTISFTEAVLVTGTPKLNLNTGRTADYASGSSTSTLTFDYVVQAGDNVAALDYAATTSLVTNGGTIRDSATNDATLTLVTPGGAGSLSANRTLRIDTTNPTESVTTPGVNGSSYNASSLPANIAGSSADAGGSGVSTMQVAIQDGAGNYWGGATFNQGSIFYNATAGTTSWSYATATLAGQLSDGHTYTITAKATDAAGNTSTTTRTFVYDTTSPTVTSVTASNTDGAYTTGQVIHVLVTFGEPITVTGTPRLTLNTTPSRTADYVSGSGTATLTFDYTIQAGDASADLDYATTGSLGLNGGTLKDAATNNATLTLPTVGGASSLGGQKNIEIDTTAPTVDSISSSNADGAYKAGQTIHVDVTFSKPVTLAGGTPTLDLNTTPEPGRDLCLRLGRHDVHIRLHGAGRRHVGTPRRGEPRTRFS